MSATHSPPSDPVNLVQQLDADAIRDRLDALDAERSALLVLLRAAQRIERQRAGQSRESEVAHDR